MHNNGESKIKPDEKSLLAAWEVALAQQDEVMKIGRKSIANSEKAVQLSEDSNRVLKEILQELKKGK